MTYSTDQSFKGIGVQGFLCLVHSHSRVITEHCMVNLSATNVGHVGASAGHNVLTSPLSPSDMLQPITPLSIVFSFSRSRSPPPMAWKAPLIDMRDWIVEDRPFGTASSKSTRVPWRLSRYGSSWGWCCTGARSSNCNTHSDILLHASSSPMASQTTFLSLQWSWI